MIKALELKVDENGKMVGLDEVTLDKVLEAIKGLTKETEEDSCENTDEEIPSKEVVIEPGKAYLLVHRIKKLLDNSEEIYKLMDSIATDDTILEAEYSTDGDSVIIVFATIDNASKFADKLIDKIKLDIPKIANINLMVETSDVELFLFANMSNMTMYRHMKFELSNKQDKGICCTAFIDKTDSPILDIERLCHRFGFECTIKDRSMNANRCKQENPNPIIGEDSAEEFSNLVESYKPDYVTKQEKLEIIQGINVIHTSFYGVFKDTLLRMNGMALHKLKLELNNNNLRGALRILLRNMRG